MKYTLYDKMTDSKRGGTSDSLNRQLNYLEISGSEGFLVRCWISYNIQLILSNTIKATISEGDQHNKNQCKKWLSSSMVKSKHEKMERNLLDGSKKTKIDTYKSLNITCPILKDGRQFGLLQLFIG